MIARVIRLTRYLQKGAPGETLPEAHLIRGLGMEGNRHQGGEKQISLLSAEALRWMQAQTEKGLCFERFKENILIEGLPFDDLSVGSLLSVGNAVLRVSMRGKRCYEACALFSKGAPCRLSGSAVFAVVEQGGAVRSGEPVCILNS